jgi:hypothetical protein
VGSHDNNRQWLRRICFIDILFRLGLEPYIFVLIQKLARLHPKVVVSGLHINISISYCFLITVPKRVTLPLTSRQTSFYKQATVFDIKHIFLGPPITFWICPLVIKYYCETYTYRCLAGSRCVNPPVPDPAFNLMLVNWNSSNPPFHNQTIQYR